VAGAIEYHGADGQVLTLGMLQAFVPHQGDAWEYTLAYLDRVLAERQHMAEDAPAPDHGAFLTLMRLLGQRTAEMHLAFGQAPADDAAFAPEPLTMPDRESLRRTALQALDDTLELLRGRIDALTDGTRDGAGHLLARAEALRARIEAFDGEAPPGQRKMRLHGDYHLGQVLVSRNDFVIIDFEGEPARPFDERRTKASPLRDVAGMLRSFNYARWSALRRVAQNADDLLRLDATAAQWEAQVRPAFMGGYVETLALAGQEDFDEAMLALFEIDKALYELRYELNNRIDWVQVPLQGLIALADDALQGGNPA